MPEGLSQRLCGMTLCANPGSLPDAEFPYAVEKHTSRLFIHSHWIQLFMHWHSCFLFLWPRMVCQITRIRWYVVKLVCWRHTIHVSWGSKANLCKINAIHANCARGVVPTAHRDVDNSVCVHACLCMCVCGCVCVCIYMSLFVCYRNTTALVPTPNLVPLDWRRLCEGFAL